MKEPSRTNQELHEEISILQQIIKGLEHSESERKQAAEALQRSAEEALRLAKENKIVADIGRIISSTISIEAIYKAFSEKVMELIPFDRIVINLFDPETNVVSCPYQEGIFVSGRQGGDILPSEGTVTAQIIRTGIGFIVQSESADEMGEKYPGLLPELQHGIRSFLTVPLISKEHVIGGLALRSTKSEAYTNRDLMLAENIANHIAGAIFNAQLFIELKRAEEAMTSAMSLLNAALESTADGILIVDRNGRITSWNQKFSDMWQIPEELLSNIIDEPVLHHVLSQMAQPEEFLAKVMELYRQPEELSVDILNLADGRVFERYSQPQRIGDDIVGRVWSFRDITDRKRAESQREDAIEALRESENRYRELSIVDDLTRLYNSRHFYFQLKIELDRSNRYEQSLTLLMLDIDNFKAFNDTYGHVEGDHVLLRLGQVVKRCLRETDFAYRYGGEEFTILLPMTTSADGAVTAERIRVEFKKETFSPAPGQDIHVTVSIGIAQYQPQEELKAFVHRVDQLMYQGKRSGKDRVCSEPQP